jgi:hypothetical protein
MKEVEGVQPDTDLVLMGAALLETHDSVPGAIYMDSVAGLSTVLADPQCLRKGQKVMSLLGDYSLWSDSPHNSCINIGPAGFPCYDVQSRPGNEPHSMYPVMWAA